MKKSIVFLFTLSILLIACGTTTQAQPTPSGSAQAIPVVVSASGKVLPARWANLSFQTGGLVAAMKVQAGDKVKAGDVIAQLNDVDAKMAVAQAEAALAVAQAQLAELHAGPRAEQVAVAEQAVKGANAALSNAAAQLAQLRSGARAADIAAAEAAVAAAYTDRKVLQDTYDKIYKVGGPLEEQTRARLNAAIQAHIAAQQRLDQLNAGATKNELDAARANVAAALAQRDSAQAQLELLQAGSVPEQIAVAEANMKQAQAALDAANAQRTKTQIVAPFDGTIGAVFIHQGENSAAGQPVVAMGDLSSLRVETTDLSEADVARVREGQAVKVTFDAMPGKTLTGRVARIAPMSTPGQSAVNYAVTVELAQLDPALRWGMTAFADVQVGE